MKRLSLLLIVFFLVLGSEAQIHKHAPARKRASRVVKNECEYRTVKVFSEDTSVIGYVLIDLASPVNDIRSFIMNKQLPAGRYEVRVTTIVGLNQRWFSALVSPYNVVIYP